MRKQHKVINKDEWEYFASAYLELAIIGFAKAYEDYDTERLNDTYDFILIPSLYNLKHGIEIMLKTLSIRFLNKDFLDESDLNHDLNKLLKKFKEAVPKKVIKEAAIEVMRQYPEIEKETVDADFIFTQLEEIVLKYIDLDVIKSKITPKDILFEDVNNTALRYPSNDLTVHLHYIELLKRITKKEVGQMRYDCQTLKVLLWKLLVLQSGLK